MDFLTQHLVGILFWVFAVGAVGCAAMVVTLRNPMYGAISLLGCFLSVAALFFLRHAEFLGVVQMFVYGGGIMVLFLFVIMLVNLHRLREVRLFGGQGPVVLVLAALLVGLFGFFFVGNHFAGANPDPTQLLRAGSEPIGNSQAVAWALYRDYLLPFEVASLFLLVAMIGAVVLGRRQ